MENIVVTHPGAQHSYRLAYAIQKANRLKYYISSMYYRPSYFPYSFFNKPSVVATLKKRHLAGLDEHKVREFIWLEAIDQAFQRVMGMSQQYANIVSWRCHYFDKLVGKRYINNTVKTVIAYPDSALHTFQAMKKYGGTCVIDAPIQHHAYGDRIFKEEATLHPEFAQSLLSAGDNTDGRMDEEYALADYIAIPSEFVRTGFEAAGLGHKLVKIPYGTHLKPATSDEITYYQKGQPLKLVYVGQITQRKGIKYALEAVKILRQRGVPVEFSLVGGISSCHDALAPYRDYFTHIPFMLRDDLRKLLLQQHVFILPSLLEGSSLALMEAIATGLVPIVSENTGAEAIRNNGYILPIRDHMGIADKVQYLYENPDQVNQMKLASLDIIQQFTWEVYYQNWIQFAAKL